MGAHRAAEKKRNAAMAKFRTALKIEVANADSACKNAHGEYEALKREVASNVNSRKQVFISTLLITCYVDNITSNASAKACADRKRRAPPPSGTSTVAPSLAAHPRHTSPTPWVLPTGSRPCVAAMLVTGTRRATRRRPTRRRGAARRSPRRLLPARSPTRLLVRGLARPLLRRRRASLPVPATVVAMARAGARPSTSAIRVTSATSSWPGTATPVTGG